METPEEMQSPAPRRRPAGAQAAKKAGAVRRPRTGKPTKGKKKKKRKLRSPAMRLLRALMLILSIASAVATIFTAYSGHISPLKHGGFWGIFPLCFPICLLCSVILIVLQVWWHWRGVIITAIGLVASAAPALQICPLHLGTPKAPEGSDTFTLLTYNVLNLNDRRDSTDVAPNHTIDYIIDQDADIVCLQEAANVTVSRHSFVTAEQIRTLHERYPYIITSSGAQTIMSKFPVQPIHLTLTKEEFDDAELAAYRISFPGGKSATLFNVHLQSFSLTKTDRELYRNLTDLQRESIQDVRTHLIHKLSVANVERARQAQVLMRLIRHYGGPDVIICGDFNDVATCYAIRTIEDAGFRSVYASLGFGPIATYNENRFYFGIDHILYRGSIVPLTIDKGTVRCSDHYPLKATLAID